MLYPLKFRTIFREKIWGGNRINEKLGLTFDPLPNCGEAWALSGVNDCQTVVENGFLAGNDLNEVLEIYMDELVGEKVYDQYGNEFPILVKFIDANDWLSIQVHPDDELAAQRGLGNGKTEMWYILDADPGAELISGFNREMNRETYLVKAGKGLLKEILNFEKVSAGDVFFIPAGRVHALGPGILLAEIQQTSDTTYRIYDWDRTDASGKPRELHTELAVDAIDFSMPGSYRTNYKAQINQTVELVESPFFTTSLMTLEDVVEKDYSGRDSFVIYVCTEGSMEIFADDEKYHLAKGEVILIPAVIDSLVIYPLTTAKILEVYIP